MLGNIPPTRMKMNCAFVLFGFCLRFVSGTHSQSTITCSRYVGHSMGPQTDFFVIWEETFGMGGIIWAHLSSLSSGIIWEGLGEVSGRTLGGLWEELRGLWPPWALRCPGAPERSLGGFCDVSGMSLGGFWGKLRRLWQLWALQGLPRGRGNNIAMSSSSNAKAR